ncbi:hypothetical protein NESM_000794900 [Novymonas esmeraldas]|uniref:Uncharacterized protein n=1 Tax=Novymonas esmeraldas TaxID=1808958 RepID=A0AAW0EWH1_9TRYP
MGSAKSKVATSPAEPPLTAASVDALCREAYAAGATDADVYHTSQREVMQQQSLMVGIGACMSSAWVAYVYGRATGTRTAGDAAALRIDAQQLVLDKASKDLATVMEENRTLDSVRHEQEVMITQQRGELERAAQQRRALQQSLAVLRRRNASVQRQLRRLKTSLAAVQRQLYVGAAGTGVLLLAVAWGTRPRRAEPSPPPPPAPVAVASEAVES